MRFRLSGAARLHFRATLLMKWTPSSVAELAAIQYASTATVNLAFRRSDIPHPLDGFGFVVPIIERRKILACTFSSIKFRGRAPEGHVLLRAFVGGALQPEMFALDEDAMAAAVRDDLRALLGIEKPPLFCWLKSGRALWPSITSAILKESGESTRGSKPFRL